MTAFTVEMTFLVPHYRQRAYEANSLEEALELARADQDWDDQKTDHDGSLPTRVTGAWKGKQPYVGPQLHIDGEYHFHLRQL